MTHEEAVREAFRRAARPSSHEHTWFLCFHSGLPPVDVYDCGCGARKRVLRGVVPGRMAEADSVNPGGSAGNSLNIAVDLLRDLPVNPLLTS